MSIWLSTPNDCGRGRWGWCCRTGIRSAWRRISRWRTISPAAGSISDLSRGYQPRSVGVMGQHYHANAAGTGRAEVEATNRKIVEEWFEVMRRSWTEDLWDLSGRIHFGAAEGSGVEAPDFGAAQCRGPRRYLDPGRNRSEAQTVAVSAAVHDAQPKPRDAQLVSSHRRLGGHARGGPRYRPLGVSDLR